MPSPMALGEEFDARTPGPFGRGGQYPTSLLVEVSTPEVNTRSQMTEATMLIPMIHRPWREVARAGRVATTIPRTSPSNGSANAVT